MSLIRAGLIAASLSFLWPGGAAFAQSTSEEPRTDRFFSDKVVEGDEMAVQGSVTSSTFVAPELGDQVDYGDFAVDNASPATRVYTELRARLGVQNLASGLDLRTDARVRVAPPCTFNTDRTAGQDDADDVDCQVQSGTYGGNEFEVRELYVQRSVGALQLRGGRQIIPELAATKIDGVRVDYAISDEWSLIGFGGLYPDRVSRSVLDDYSVVALDGESVLVLPAAAGAGGAYSYGRFFGSVGAAGVVPLTNGDGDTPRTFVTSNGYWRPSSMLDLYHFASVDITGDSAEELADRFTNVSIGVNLKPVQDLRVTAGLHHFSTETLDELARYRLEQQDERNAVQNNVEILRVASQSARLGASLALMERRFEVSTSFQVRRKPNETVCAANDLDCMAADGLTTFDAYSGETSLSVVDRRSIGGLRLGASVLYSVGLYSLGLGDDAFGRSNFLVGRVDASRSLMDEKLQVDADISFLRSQDSGDNGCGNQVVNALECYGTALVNTVSVGGTVYYRFLPDWFGMLTANGAFQTFDPGATADLESEDADASASNVLLTGFLRVAYRF